MAPLPLAVVFKTLGSRAINLPLNALRRKLVKENWFDFQNKVLKIHKNYVFKETETRLKLIRYMDQTNFPSDEGIRKLADKNSNKAISNKSRVVEYYADFLIYSLSIPMYVAVLLFVYYLWEADAKEEEKARAKETTERIETTLETLTSLESRLGRVKSTNDDLEKLLYASQEDNRLLHANLSRLITDLKMTKQSNK